MHAARVGRGLALEQRRRLLVRLLLGELQQFAGAVDLRPQAVVGAEDLLQPRPLPAQLAAQVRVLPEFRIFLPADDLRQPPALGVAVKDTP